MPDPQKCFAGKKNSLHFFKTSPKSTMGKHKNTVCVCGLLEGALLLPASYWILLPALLHWSDQEQPGGPDYPWGCLFRSSPCSLSGLSGEPGWEPSMLSDTHWKRSSWVSGFLNVASIPELQKHLTVNQFVKILFKLLIAPLCTSSCPQNWEVRFLLYCSIYLPISQSTYYLSVCCLSSIDLCIYFLSIIYHLSVMCYLSITYQSSIIYPSPTIYLSF